MLHIVEDDQFNNYKKSIITKSNVSWLKCKMHDTHGKGMPTRLINLLKNISESNNYLVYRLNGEDSPVDTCDELVDVSELEGMKLSEVNEYIKEKIEQHQAKFLNTISGEQTFRELKNTEVFLLVQACTFANYYRKIAKDGIFGKNTLSFGNDVINLKYGVDNYELLGSWRNYRATHREYIYTFAKYRRYLFKTFKNLNNSHVNPMELLTCASTFIKDVNTLSKRYASIENEILKDCIDIYNTLHAEDNDSVKLFLKNIQLPWDCNERIENLEKYLKNAKIELYRRTINLFEDELNTLENS